MSLIQQKRKIVAFGNPGGPVQRDNHSLDRFFRRLLAVVVLPGECDGNQARQVPGFQRLVDGVPVVFYQQHGVVAHLSYLFFQRADDRAVECIVDQ